MKIIDLSPQGELELQNGDVISEDGKYFMVVKIITGSLTEKYGYMNLETGVVMSAQYNSAIEMYDSCFAPNQYDTRLKRIEEITVTDL